MTVQPYVNAKRYLKSCKCSSCSQGRTKTVKRALKKAVRQATRRTLEGAR